MADEKDGSRAPRTPLCGRGLDDTVVVGGVGLNANVVRRGDGTGEVWSAMTIPSAARGYRAATALFVSFFTANDDKGEETRKPAVCAAQQVTDVARDDEKVAWPSPWLQTFLSPL